MRAAVLNHVRSDIPAYIAGLDAFTALLLLGAWAAARHRRSELQRRLTGAAFVLSAFSPGCFIFYRHLVGFVPFWGIGPTRLLYFPVLLSRAILAAAVVLMILRGLYLARTDRLMEYSRLARWTLPLWLYVAAAGAALFWMRDRAPASGWYELREKIDAAAGTPGAPAWAGTYSDDAGIEGPDIVVTLSTAGYYCRGCGRSWGRDWGTVEPSGDGILLLRAAGWGPPKTWRLISWDDRVYAISDDQKLEFVNKVNESLGPGGRGFVGFMPYKSPENGRGGLFMRGPAPLGLPRVPEDWRPLLLDRPVEAAITKVGPIRYVRDIYPRRISVELDAGRRRGLVPGQRLRLRNFESATEIVLMNVAEDSSSGEAWQSDVTQPFESQRLPWVGQLATSYWVPGDIWERR